MPEFRRKPLCRRIALSALCAALLSPPGWAVGLGDIALQSHLGKPLQARIPLTHLGDLAGDQIKVSLGSEQDYARLGVDRDFLHSQIRLEPVVDDGGAYVQLSTSRPVVEPYINIVISLRWPNGQLVREYTMLLDLPAVAAPVVAGATTSAPAAPAVAMAPRPTASAAPLVRDGRYRTARGDSLWGLAQRLRPAGVTAEQMMAALYAANPEAFLNGDPARLKEAMSLQVPTAAQAVAAAPLPTSSRHAPAVGPAPAQPELPDRFAGTGVSVAATTSEAATAGDEARLELLAPTEVEQLTAENAALRDEVRGLTSNLGALTSQLERSEQRLQQLEQQLQQVLAGYDRQRGVDGTAAGASPFAATGAGAGAQPAPVATDGIAAAQPVPGRDASPWVHLAYWIALGVLGGWALYQYSRGRRTDAAETVLEPVEPTPLTPPQPAARVLPREQAPARGVEPIAAEPAATGWGSAGDNERYWQHHTDSTDELPLDLLDAEPVDAPAPAVAAVPGSADEPVDASISAGVFVAFGRYTEAEQVLQEALQRDPSRRDLQLQLLDVYQQADMREAFEQLARTLESECADEPDIVGEVAALRDSYSGRF